MENNEKELKGTQSGVIKMVHYNKGYGFIHSDDGEDYFFHISGLIEPKFADITEGMRVEFLVTPVEQKKDKAIKIVAFKERCEELGEQE